MKTDYETPFFEIAFYEVTRLLQSYFQQSYPIKKLLPTKVNKCYKELR